MSPLDAKLILDEIAKLNRRFDESYARMERCFSRTLATLEPRGDAVELRVGSPEQFGATQPVMADNWGGLFGEIPTPDATSTDSDAPPFAPAPDDSEFHSTDGDAASTVEPNPDPEAGHATLVAVKSPHLDDIVDLDRLSILPDALLCNIVSRLPLKEAARTAVLSCRWRPVFAAPSVMLVPMFPEGELFCVTTQEGNSTVQREKVQMEAKPFFLEQIEQDAIGSAHAPSVRRRGRGPCRRRRPPRLLVPGHRPRLRARALPQPGAVHHPVRAPPRRRQGRTRGFRRDALPQPRRAVRLRHRQRRAAHTREGGVRSCPQAPQQAEDDAEHHPAAQQRQQPDPAGARLAGLVHPSPWLLEVREVNKHFIRSCALRSDPEAGDALRPECPHEVCNISGVTFDPRDVDTNHRFIGSLDAFVRGAPGLVLLPLPRDAASPIPFAPRQAFPLVLATAVRKSGAHSVPAARVFDEMWSYHSVHEFWHERFLEEAKHDEAIGSNFSGTLPFIDAEGSTQDRFAQCIGGFLSVVVTEMQLGTECVDIGMLLTSIKSGGYTSQVAGNGRRGSVYPKVMNASVLSKLKIINHGRGCDRGVSSVHIIVHTSIASQPWLPPTQGQSVQMKLCIDISFDAVHLRPIPWPFFCGYAAPVHLKTSLSVNTMLVNSTQLYLGFWSLIWLGWVAVQYKPPWPPPQSNGTWFQLSVSFVISCSLRQSTVPFFRYVSCHECWKLWLELLQNAVQVAEPNDIKLSCTWLRVYMIQLFPGKIQALTIILLHLINDRRAMLLLSVGQWGMILSRASMLKREFLVEGEHLVVTVTSNMQPLFQCCLIAVARIRAANVSATLMETGILQITIYLVPASLVQDGNQQSCYRICRDACSSALALSLQKLGIEKLTKDYMQQWVASNMKIGTWTRIMQITVQWEPQLLGFSNGKPLVGGVDGTIYARPIICFSFDAMEVGDYPYVRLLKHPWPPPVLLHLPLAGAGLRPIQWPSFCCYGAAKKFTLLLFRGSNHGPNYIFPSSWKVQHACCYGFLYT